MSVKIAQAQKALNFEYVSWCKSLLYCLYLILLHLHILRRNDEIQEIDTIDELFALLVINEELVVF